MTGVQTAVLCVCVLLELVGFAIFLQGFLVLKSALPGYATIKDQLPIPQNVSSDRPDIRSHPPYDRLVITVIDALRSDFILPDTNSDLPKMAFTASLTSQHHSLSFLAKSHPPTVTLPRVKALTTGGVPGFVDVMLNFDSKKLQEDNILTQMKTAGHKMIFFGDDTWIRLFPGHFVREDGTTSFFVTDYTEVDNNVTRHLDSELIRSDWDVMILHFLGLDHIGHLAGPRSPLVPAKLQEMDSIIKRMYHSLTEQDEKLGRSTMMVVCGDHGMSDQGSHGGSSHYETATPLIMLSNSFKSKGLPYNHTEIQQVDLVPTLSLLLGLPIPKNNLGMIIRHVLMQTWNNTDERLQALHMNAQQLAKVFVNNIHKYGSDPSYLELERAIKSHKHWLRYKMDRTTDINVDKLGEKLIGQYYSALYQMREKLTATRVSYDIHAMGFGIAILWLVLMAVIYCVMQNGGAVNLSFAPTGWVTFISMLGLLCSAHVLECTGKRGSPLLCGTDFFSVAMTGMLMVMASFWITVLVSRLFFMGYGTSLLIFVPRTFIGKWFWTATICHTLSLLASSFVEEEHQTCYLITMTSIVLLLLHHIITSIPMEAGDEAVYDEKLRDAGIAVLHQSLYCKHSHSEAEIRSALHQLTQQQSKVNKKHKDKLAIVVNMMPVIAWAAAAAGLARVMRAWNRTGDKWAHLPDIGDWLVRPDNKMILSFTCAAALLLVVGLNVRRKHNITPVILQILGATMIYAFRAANGAILIPFVTTEVTKGVLEARIVYGVIFILLVNSVWRYLRLKSTSTQLIALPFLAESLDSIKLALQLLILLLMRPHNIPLAAMTFMLEAIIAHLTVATCVSQSDLILLYYWFGQASFFYQGNSNSIATVDVSAGYIGLDDYQPLVIGILMCLATYAGPIYWLFAYMTHFCHSNKTSKPTVARRQMVAAAGRLWLIRALPLAFYTVLVTIQRYHLFVWTVFSPKLLYEGMFTIVLAIVVMAMLILQNIIS